MNKDLEVIRLYNLGLTIGEIKDMTGVSTGRILYIINNAHSKNLKWYEPEEILR